MAKRRADKQLTHDNWDNDEPKEEAGSFTRASAEILQNRVIKTARRSMPSGISPANSPLPNQKLSLTNGCSVKPAEIQDNSKACTFADRMTKLNESLLGVMKKCMEATPYCDFRPTFEDYKRHVISLESTTTDSQKPEKDTACSKPSPFANFSFGASKSDSSSSSVTAKPFSFSETKQSESESSVSTATNGTSAAPKFSFGLGASTSPLFTFAPSPPTTGEQSKASDGNLDDEPYSPPEPAVTEVEEPDAVYSISCKLFYKKDESFVERGLGTLFLKRTEDNKPQLIIRAKTTLGNILLNIVMKKDQHLTRMGKNNVATICIPTPPINPKAPHVPALFLIRVKDGEKADELLKQMQDFVNDA